MTAKKKKASGGAEAGQRKRRSDEEKAAIVRQILASDNRTAEMKRVGIYPNQFYSWKKLFGGRGVERGANAVRAVSNAARGVADEAKAYLDGRADLLNRLKAERSKLDELITALEG